MQLGNQCWVCFRNRCSAERLNCSFELPIVVLQCLNSLIWATASFFFKSSTSTTMAAICSSKTSRIAFRNSRMSESIETTPSTFTLPTGSASLSRSKSRARFLAPACNSVRVSLLSYWPALRRLYARLPAFAFRLFTIMCSLFL